MLTLQDGTSITGVNMSSSLINSNMGMFVMEMYSGARNVMLCYGFGWKGTYAAGKRVSRYENLPKL